MVFVSVRHEIRAEGRLAMEEDQDIVYMGIPEQFRYPDPIAAPPGDWRETVAIDPVLLFRFSALTFNGHRIHYDRRYAMEVEKYPGLVVHGPLQAVLLFDAACRHAPDRVPSRFDFRGVRPLFDFDAATVSGRLGGRWRHGCFHSDRRGRGLHAGDNALGGLTIATRRLGDGRTRARNDGQDSSGAAHR